MGSAMPALIVATESSNYFVRNGAWPKNFAQLQDSSVKGKEPLQEIQKQFKEIQLAENSAGKLVIKLKYGEAAHPSATRLAAQPERLEMIVDRPERMNGPQKVSYTSKIWFAQSDGSGEKVGDLEGTFEISNEPE